MAKSRQTQSSEDAGANEPSAAVAPLELEQPAFSDGELGTLQEILFGKQIVSQANQISSLQSYVEDHLANLQKNCQEQFTELHRKLDESLSGVNSRLEQNDEKQTTGLTETKNSITAAESKLLAQLAQANDNNGKVQGQLEEQLNKANQQLNQSMQTSRDEILKRLETAIAELNEQKLDKGALSSLLGDVATQLTGQAKT